MRPVFFLSGKNNFRPSFFGPKALITYGVLTAITFIALFPVGKINFNVLIASLTQDFIVSELNSGRQGAGLQGLRVNEKLTQAAILKAKDMAEKNYFSHIGPEGEEPWVWLDRADYSYAIAGENLAIDVADGSRLVSAWLASKSHWENIMNKNFIDVGIGSAKGVIGGRKTTVVVMFLGREITPALASISATSGALGGEIKNTPPQEPAFAKIIEEKILDEEKLVISETKKAITGNGFGAGAGRQLFFLAPKQFQAYCS